MAVHELPKDVLKMASGLISPSGLAGHCRPLCIGGTAVMESARMGHGDIVQYLHQAGADINIRDNDGRTALMWAAYKGHGDIVKYLHQAGADINIMDNGGVTALIAAASEGHGDIVKYFHQAGTDTNIIRFIRSKYGIWVDGQL